MADINYPGLALVQNFLEKLDVDKIDLSLEGAPEVDPQPHQAAGSQTDAEREDIELL